MIVQECNSVTKKSSFGEGRHDIRIPLKLKSIKMSFSYGQNIAKRKSLLVSLDVR